MPAAVTDDKPDPEDAADGRSQPDRRTLARWRKIVVVLAGGIGLIFVFLVLVKLLGSVPDNLPVFWTLTATVAFGICFIAVGPGKVRRGVPGSIAVITLVASIFALFGPFSQPKPKARVRAAVIPRGEKLVEIWDKCPASNKPVAAHPALQLEKRPAHVPQWYGKAHIDSVIAPDGGAYVGDQALVCMTTLTEPGPSRTLWLILRLPATAGDGGRKLFFPVTPISNPKPGRFSFRLVNNGCASPVSGDYHTLMIVSTSTAQNRRLWKIRDAGSSANCENGYKTDYLRHVLIGTVVSDQVDVIYKEKSALPVKH